MDSFYKFASENPWLTFFLFLLIGQTLIHSVEAAVKPFSKKRETKDKKELS